MRETGPETLLTTNSLDVKRWTTLVERSPAQDVYYSPEYAEATAEIEQTEPIALVAGPPSCRILAPLLIRRTPATIKISRSEWLDASTPYGYGGLLGLSGHPHPDALHAFLYQLNDWCLGRGLVCCVIRLHPLTAQNLWFHTNDYWSEQLQIHSRGTTSSIELAQWDGGLDQPCGLRRDRRADLRLATSTLRTTWTTGEAHDSTQSLNIFLALYEKLIERNGADRFFRFPESYFVKLKMLGSRLGIALTWYRDEPVGGNLFLAGPRYAHGHLAATNDIGRKYGASTFLIIEGARWARRRGCELLHLGGGMRPGDSLDDFKRSFGGPSHVYHYVTFVADRKRFDEICKLPFASWPYNLLDSATQHDGRPKE